MLFLKVSTANKPLNKTTLNFFYSSTYLCVTCQFICNVVYNVGIVQPPSLILPPTLDVDTWLPLKVRQMEVVPVNSNKKQQA